jgi:NADPH:quinone reductase
VLRVGQAPDPVPGPGELLVEVQAIGLNYAEVLSRKGLYGWAPKRPYILGMEAVGTVGALGEGAEGWAVGDTVLVGRQYGSYAEKLVVATDAALRPPPGYSLEENAAFGVNYMTAWVALMEMARVRTTDRVAVTAAAGGVGTAAVQIAHHFGCEVVALAGSDEKLALARERGADITVNYRTADVQRRLGEAVGRRGVDVVLETVGGEVFAACDAVLAPFGRIVVAGYAGLDYRLWNPLSWWRAWSGRPRMGIERMFKGSNGLLSTHLGYLLSNPERLNDVWTALTAFVTEHGIRPVVGHVMDFERVADAHRLMESRASVGKIVLRV